MEYNITLITEELPTENDFALPEGVKRIVIENSRKIAVNYIDKG